MGGPRVPFETASSNVEVHRYDTLCTQSPLLPDPPHPMIENANGVAAASFRAPLRDMPFFAGSMDCF